MSLHQKKARQDVWRSQERHYCSYCNKWMAPDRQSILVHEQGKKHIEAVQQHQAQQKKDRLQHEKAQNLLQSSLQAVERAAAAAHAQDRTYGGTPLTAAPVSATTASSSLPPSKQLQPSKQEKQAWESKKKKRELEKCKKNASDDDDDNDASSLTTKKPKTTTLGPDEGHYTMGTCTYLEGAAYASLLEDDLPVDLWVGSGLASLQERKLASHQHQWRRGLIVSTRKSSSDPTGIVADVAYLLNTTDEEETLEKSVSPPRLRLILGSDPKLPETLAEARLAVMGTEVQQVQASLQVDEATGLSSWGTVEIRKTTVRNELKQERALLRQQRKEEQQRQAQEEKKTQERIMEEQKVANAEDSALGAYNVWGTDGYKGVSVQDELKLQVTETAKSLAQGKAKVGFKKKKISKKQNRRTTSAGDED